MQCLEVLLVVDILISNLAGMKRDSLNILAHVDL